MRGEGGGRTEEGEGEIETSLLTDRREGREGEKEGWREVGREGRKGGTHLCEFITKIFEVNVGE